MYTADWFQYYFSLCCMFVELVITAVIRILFLFFTQSSFISRFYCHPFVHAKILIFAEKAVKNQAGAVRC